MASPRRGAAGMVIVEATFVYPVVFLVLIFVLMLGDVYYQRARIEAVVIDTALVGSASASSSALEQVVVDQATGLGVMDASKIENDPYRFVFNMGSDGSVSENLAKYKESLTDQIGDGDASFFGLAPDIGSADVQYTSRFIYGDYLVSAGYDVDVPMATMLMPEGKATLGFGATAVSTVTSMGELTRNIDLVDDAYRSSGAKDLVDAVDNLATKVHEYWDALQELASS